MNNLNLENRLRSWTPRRPSAEIGKQLFATPALPAQARWRQGWWNWLAPLAAGGAALVIFWTASGGGAGQGGDKYGSTSFAAVVLSNLSSSSGDRSTSARPNFVLSKANLNLENNICEKATFDWTNRSQSPLSIPSLPSAKTNFLRR